MAFIEPMHRNKPNITYLLTELILWDIKLRYELSYSDDDMFSAIKCTLLCATFHNVRDITPLQHDLDKALTWYVY